MIKLLAVLRFKYKTLTKKQQVICKISTVGIGFLLVYLLLHALYLLLFGPKHPTTPTMMIRHGARIEIPKDSPLRAQIEFKQIALSTAPHMLTFPALVEAIPSRHVAILPPLTGRLVSIHVTIGDTVKKDQIVATMYSQDMAQAYSDYEKAKSAHTLTQVALKRAKAVYQAGGNSLQTVQQAENDDLQAASELKRAKASLFILEQSIAATEPGNATGDGVREHTKGLIVIRSPISGRVMGLHYGHGATVNDITAPLMTVVNLDKVWVTTNISEGVVSKIQVGAPVEITFVAYPDHPFQGKINFVHPVIDPETRRNKTRILLPNQDKKLMPNMYATVRVSVAEEASIMIPLSSVLMNNESAVVYVESSPWVCQRREIELGDEDGGFVRVLSGLKPGERIVTCGGVFINDK